MSLPENDLCGSDENESKLQLVFACPQRELSVIALLHKLLFLGRETTFFL